MKGIGFWIASALCLTQEWTAYGFMMPSVQPSVPKPHHTVLSFQRNGVGGGYHTSTPPLITTTNRPQPLWLKGSLEDPDKLKLPPPIAEGKDNLQEFFAARGVDERQLNLLLNLGFLTLVSIAVLTKVVTVDLDAWRGWTPGEIFFRIPLDNWDGYMSTLTEHPVLVKAVTSGSVYTIGDWIAQMYEGKSLGDIDRGRVARSAAAGFIGHGPLSHMWYGVSEGFFDWLGWEGWWTTFPKITVDQLVWGPIWNGCYIALLGLMKREGLGDIWNQVRSTSVSLVVSGLKLWPLAHVVTYGVIPVENRLLWVDLVEILWVTILSKQANDEGVEGGGAHGGAPSVDAIPPTNLSSTEVPTSENSSLQQQVPAPVIMQPEKAEKDQSVLR